MSTLTAVRWVRSGRWLALLMLLLLHLSLWLGIHHPWVRPLLLAHLGVFLAWQPLWRSETKLSWGNAAFILGVSFAALVWLNWWLVAFWIISLFALVGGRVFSFHTRWQRLYYLLMMAYLQAVLVLLVVPELFNLPAVEELKTNLMNFGLPLLLLVIAAVPVERDDRETVQVVDFVYVLLLFTLLILLILGSLAFMTLGHVGYVEALLRTLSVLAVALFVLGGLWNPHMGFSGLQAGFSRYVLSIGTPLEEWLKRIAAAARQEQSPADFLARATQHLAEMPWIAGIAWVSEEGFGSLGESSLHRVELADGDLVLTLFARQAVSPTVLLHARLLVNVLGHFYQGKRHEQALKEMARQQAIYETGARLTHDLKNMLQSLFALTAIARHEPARAQPILRVQLPVLAERIETLLAKLQSPHSVAEEADMPCTLWWERLRLRHQHRDIEWELSGSGDGLVPSAMFDCVADNLIENACNKRLREADLRILLKLDASTGSLNVTDSGSAIPLPLVQHLLHKVLASEDGLGVGLYQAGRWAQQLGYRLYLAENHAGCVRFELLRE